MKNLVKLTCVFWAAVLLMAGCQKEENFSTIKPTEKTQLFGEPNQPANLGEKSLQLEINKPKNNLKGLLGTEDYLTTGWAYQVGNSSESYKTIRVDRPNGRFFYIMIENLHINPNTNGSWVYNNDNANIQEYGRLYDWTNADNLKQQVYMQLPMINSATGQIIKNVNVAGSLPTFDDLKDLLEVSYIGNLPSNGTDIFDVYNNGWYWYYDAFLAGIEDQQMDYTSAYHSLGGWRDNLDVVPNNQEFNNINQLGVFWTSVASTSGNHYPLRISYNETPTTYYFSSYINVGCANRYGFSVRYVFYPQYR
jgi:uncharacterized protein (TIGR02145 family)